MYRPLIVASVLINFVIANDRNSLKHGSENNKAMAGSDVRTNTTHHNITYIDKAENMIRLPSMSKYLEDKKMKKKPLKKSPRRTIQKIIKKNKSKIKKLYMIKMTSYPTVMPKDDFENAKEETSRKQETTTQSSMKKRQRKWNSKLPRYPMPFHQMQTKKNTYKRLKRDASNLFILKDLDELQFLKEKKDYNVVNAHFKKYW